MKDTILCCRTRSLLPRSRAAARCHANTITLGEDVHGTMTHTSNPRDAKYATSTLQSLSYPTLRAHGADKSPSNMTRSSLYVLRTLHSPCIIAFGEKKRPTHICTSSNDQGSFTITPLVSRWAKKQTNASFILFDFEIFADLDITELKY